ncbi:hypothetical protein AK812_SmicGene9278 [Symbiodinium microadriaticum]|uniref:Uncharacterized protein n=1 Tax=Symbiodinium microadriaticum TaxID=2951 RepID=A0A1Q9EIV4_SYMMI|nr:hypothetical protein AK812_SmicGene9278 [Symbiodinium microadriaticum]
MPSASHGRFWAVAAGLSRLASAHDREEGFIALPLHNRSSFANLSAPNSGNPFRGSPIWTPGSEIDCSETCSSWRDCNDWPMRMCATDDYCGRKVCLHKRLFPMLGGDATFFFVIFIVAFLAGAPGIGGGGINVPLLMMLNRLRLALFAVVPAVAHAQASLDFLQGPRRFRQKFGSAIEGTDYRTDDLVMDEIVRLIMVQLLKRYSPAPPLRDVALCFGPGFCRLETPLPPMHF